MRSTAAYFALGMLALSSIANAQVPQGDGTDEAGLAWVRVGASPAYLCHDAYALMIAGNEGAKQQMGEVNYMQAMILGGCMELEPGLLVRIRDFGQKLRTGQGHKVAITSNGNVVQARALLDWYGKPLLESTLHFDCRTESTFCGLKY